jgi:hypothetical protein
MQLLVLHHRLKPLPVRPGEHTLVPAKYPIMPSKSTKQTERNLRKYLDLLTDRIMGVLIGIVAFCIIACMLVGPEYHGTQ